jgi:hypothetical protein
MTCVELSSAVGVVQLSSAPGGVLGVVAGWVRVGAGFGGEGSSNVQNSLVGFGPSGQTRVTSNPLKGVGRSLFGPWEFWGGKLRPHFGPSGRREWAVGVVDTEGEK